jgi:uncharacterized membrane protein (Fun14 family)
MIDSVSLTTPLVSFGGSTVAGFFIGMLLKRVLRIILIIVGSFLGLLFLTIQYMSHRGYLSGQINWDRIGNDTGAWFQSLATQFSPHGVFSFLGVEATSGLAIGAALGLVKG